MKPKINHLLCSLFMAALPIGFTPAPDDSTETNLQLWGGAGQYALISRGCDNEVLEKQRIPFQEVSASLDYKTASPVRVGIRGSYIRSKRKLGESIYDAQAKMYHTQLIATDIFAVNPFINLEGEKFTFGAGYLWANNHLDTGNASGKQFPSIYMRIGNFLPLFVDQNRSIFTENLYSYYVDFSFLHTAPLLSDGYLKMGVGFNMDPNVEWWLGWGWLPQDKFGFIARANIRLRQHLYFGALARIGSSEGISESAVSLGLTYRIKGKNEAGPDLW